MYHSPNIGGTLVPPDGKMEEFETLRVQNSERSGENDKYRWRKHTIKETDVAVADTKVIVKKLLEPDASNSTNTEDEDEVLNL